MASIKCMTIKSLQMICVYHRHTSYSITSMVYAVFVQGHFCKMVDSISAPHFTQDFWSQLISSCAYSNSSLCISAQDYKRMRLVARLYGINNHTSYFKRRERSNIEVRIPLCLAHPSYACSLESDIHLLRSTQHH